MKKGQQLQHDKVFREIVFSNENWNFVEQNWDKSGLSISHVLLFENEYCFLEHQAIRRRMELLI